MLLARICAICLLLWYDIAFHRQFQPEWATLQVGAGRVVVYSSDRATARFILGDVTSVPRINFKYSGLFAIVLIMMSQATDGLARSTAEILPRESSVISKNELSISDNTHATTYSPDICGLDSGDDIVSNEDRNKEILASGLNNKMASAHFVERITQPSEDNGAQSSRDAASDIIEENGEAMMQLCLDCFKPTTVDGSISQATETTSTTAVNINKQISAITASPQFNTMESAITHTGSLATTSIPSDSMWESQLNLQVTSQKLDSSNKETTQLENANTNVNPIPSDSSPQLIMKLTFENLTVFYPGSYQESPFQDEDHIFLNDSAFKEKITTFSFQKASDVGNAYSIDIGDASVTMTIQCVIEQAWNELIYAGWHRWEYNTSDGMSLNCVADPTNPKVRSPYYKETTYPLWKDIEIGDTQTREDLGLTASVSGYYLCIAVDSKYNVFVSSYHDIRIINVVSLKNSRIIPLKVTIYKNDTQLSFVNKHCVGSYLHQQQSTTLSQKLGVKFLYLDKAMAKNESFTYRYLQKRHWTSANARFDNLNLYCHILIQCNVVLSMNFEIRQLAIYFRHDTPTKRPEKAFTAVTNEALNFSCKEQGDEMLQPTPTSASYFEGNCSDTKPSFSSSGVSNITLTITKPVCLVCSSSSEQVKLQINVEDNLIDKLMTGTKQSVGRNCSVLLDLQSELKSVQNSSQCENNVDMLNRLHQYQTGSRIFKPFTYLAYYTTRQFIVCQNMAVEWSELFTSEWLTVESATSPTGATSTTGATSATSDTGATSATSATSDANDSKTLLLIVVGLFFLTVILLILLEWMRKRKRKQQSPEVQLENIAMPYFLSLASRSVLNVDDFSDRVDFVHPREIFERSRISLEVLIGRGRFGLVYKANIKSVANSCDALKVAVKEIKRVVGKSGTKCGRIDQEIQIMRMIVPHLNVVRYYGFSLGAESNLLVMEFVGGPSLLEYLHEKRMRVPGFVLKINFRSDYIDIAQDEVNHDPTHVTGPIDDFNISVVSDNVKNAINNFDSIRSKTSQLDFHDKALEENSDQKYSKPFNRVINDGSESDLTQLGIETEVASSKKSIEEQGYDHKGKKSNEQVNMTDIATMSKEMISICRQVARGMSHIASLNVIHCDLAARNVIVQSTCGNPLVAKICDFGMAQSLAEGEFVYKGDSKGPRPFRWMSPEALNKGEFSVFSDVWSFGVLCWEIVTLGSTPYGRLPTFAAAAKVAAGQQLPRPPNCCQEIFSILKSCWRLKPDERPSFTDLELKWSGILEANSDYLELIGDTNDASC